MDKFEKALQNAYGYEHFLGLTDDLGLVGSTNDFMEKLRMHLGEDIKDEVRALKGDIKILAFAEIWCADCRINIPPLEMMEELCSSISLKIIGRTGNEDYIMELTGSDKVRIPTVVVYKDGLFKGIFIEKPSIVLELEKSEDHQVALAASRDFRNGKYMSDTIKDMIRIING